MLANSISSYIKRYWLWFVLVLLGIVVFFVLVMAPKGTDKSKILKSAEKAVEKLRVKKTKQLEALDQEMVENTKELNGIKAINDEKERLRRLAEFANRKRKA